MSVVRICLLHLALEEEGTGKKKKEETERRGKERKRRTEAGRRVLQDAGMSGTGIGHVVIVLGGHVTLSWPFGQRVQGCSLVKLMHP